MLRPEVRHICQMERPTNLKLRVQVDNVEYEDSYHRHAITSKVKDQGRKVR